MRRDVVVDPLEPIYVAPRRFPGSEIAGEGIHRSAEGFEEVGRRAPRRRDILHDRYACCARVATEPSRHALAPVDRQRRRYRLGAPPIVPAPERGDRLGELRLQCVGRRCLIVRREERRNHALERGEIAVERCGRELATRPIALPRQHAQRMVAPRGLLRAGLDVARIVLAPGTRSCARRRPGPVVRIVDKAARGIHNVRRLVERQDPAVRGARIAGVHRLCPVERGIAARDVVRVEVRDVAGGIGKQGVVGGVGMQLHDLAKAGQVVCFRARVGLNQRVDVIVHQAHAHQPIAFLAHDWPVRRVVDREGLPRDAAIGFERDGDRARA